jgi:glyoxylase-like metal-dependent hydrolase (beta-lactamase superfamily II)
MTSKSPVDPAPMSPIPFVPPIEVVYGAVERISPLVRRVTAENPSKYTYLGTGTYIVGHGDVAVIDPGPNVEAHRDALAVAIAGERVRAILITHTHADHSPLAAWLAAETGAPTYGFAPHGAVEAGPAEPTTDGEGRREESADLDFVPTIQTGDGEVIRGPRWTMTAVHTPGHCSNHLCFSLEQEATLFTGDHVMGWSTAVISPPDGDMAAYFASLDKLLQRRTDAVYRPTHGGPIDDPRAFVHAYLGHRLARELQILDELRRHPTTVEAIVAVLYAAVRTELHRAAGRSVHAHLLKLIADGTVVELAGTSPVAYAAV